MDTNPASDSHQQRAHPEARPDDGLTATASQHETQARLFGSAFVLVQHLARRMDEMLAPMDLTTRQWLLLAILSRSGRPLSLSESAARYGSSRQNIKQIAVGLERRGYLRLLPDPDDARTLRLHLTDAIRRFDEPATAEQGRAFLADVFSELTPHQLTELEALMRRWLASAAGETARALGLGPVADPAKPMTSSKGDRS